MTLDTSAHPSTASPSLQPPTAPGRCLSVSILSASPVSVNSGRSQCRGTWRELETLSSHCVDILCTLDLFRWGDVMCDAAQQRAIRSPGTFIPTRLRKCHSSISKIKLSFKFWWRFLGGSKPFPQPLPSAHHQVTCGPALGRCCCAPSSGSLDSCRSLLPSRIL